MFCDEVQTKCSPFVSWKRLNEIPFEIVLGGESLLGAGAPDGRSLHQQYVDVGGRVCRQRLEQACLAPVSTEVAGVEHPLAVGLDQQRIGVEGAVGPPGTA